MRRLILWSTALIAIFSLVAVIAVQIGRRQPLPERVAILHLTDCKLPCWIGIVPGKTTIKEAREQVKKTYPDLKFTYFTGEDGLDGLGINSDRFEVYFAVEYKVTDDAIVDSIWLRNYSAPASLGEFYSTLRIFDETGFNDGDPAHVYMTLNKPHVYMLLHRNPCGTVSLSQSVEEITIDPKFSSRQWWSSVQPQPWRGFRICYNPTP